MYTYTYAVAMSTPDDVIRRIAEFLVDDADECPHAEDVLSKSSNELWMRKKAREIYRYLRDDGFAMINITLVGKNDRDTNRLITRFIAFKERLIPIIESRGWAAYIRPHGKSCIFHIREPLPVDTEYHRRYHHPNMHI